jgi:methionyl-tRNA formyltransferase
MNEKGLAVLRSVIDTLGAHTVAAVVIQEDPGVDRDYLQEIVGTAESAGIRTVSRAEPLPPRSFSVAVGWRFMIRSEPRLVVFHDSLLPRYRGFAPLVNALINGEAEIGVTALWGAERYDSGPIIDQAAIAVNYPLTIQDAITEVTPLYERLATEITQRLLAGEDISGHEQDESKATYSIWRDEDDYLIDWTQDARYVARFIDAVGPPYKGACSHVGGRRVRILRAEAVKAESIFEIRHPGKVFSVSDGVPTVVCGEGMIRLLALSDATTGDSLLPWTHLRTRFRDE